MVKRDMLEGYPPVFLSDTDISLRDLAWRMWCRDSIQGSTTDSLLALKWK